MTDTCREPRLQEPLPRALDLNHNTISKIEKRGDRMIRTRAITLLLFAILLPGMLLTQGCGGNSEASQSKDTMNGKTGEDMVNVAIKSVQPQPFSSRLLLVGEVMSETNAMLACEIGGRLLSVKADRGSRVGRGDTLVVLDARRYRAAYDAASAQMENARLDMQMADRLYQSGNGISETDWKKAQNGLRMAEAALANARIDLENCFILAPFAGTVADRFVDKGELVSPGTPVLQLVQDQRLKVRAGLPENQITFGRKGLPVSIKVPEAGIVASGQVSWVGSILDSRSRTLPLDITLQESRGLKVGMACQIELVRDHGSASLVVPVTIVQSAPDQLFLFVEADGRAVRRVIQLGDRDGSMVEVISGLNAGDRIITSGHRGLVDGQPLRVIEQ